MSKDCASHNCAHHCAHSTEACCFVGRGLSMRSVCSTCMSHCHLLVAEASSKHHSLFKRVLDCSIEEADMAEQEWIILSHCKYTLCAFGSPQIWLMRLIINIQTTLLGAHHACLIDCWKPQFLSACRLSVSGLHRPSTRCMCRKQLKKKTAGATSCTGIGCLASTLRSAAIMPPL